MYTLFTMVFKDQFQAEKERLDLRMKPIIFVNNDKLVSVERDPEGQAHMHHGHMFAADGALLGWVWGSIVGMAVLNPLLGMLAGTGVGAAVGSLGDIGIHQHYLKSLAGHLTPGSSALFLFVEKKHLEDVRPVLESRYPLVLHANLNAEDESALQQALDKIMKANS